MDEKSKNTPKVKEKRQAYSQDGAPKKINKHQNLLRNDAPQLSSSLPFEGGSPVKKLLSETNKIVKIGMEKDFALLKIDNSLQNSNETIETLRKNMLHLQMEYEKLDQNFQREVSCRTEIVKRMDATRELVESIVQCSNVLGASIKQLEDDKLKIAAFYELIYQNQKEVEAKHIQAEKIMKEHQTLTEAKMEEIEKLQNQILTQHSDTVSQFNKKLANTSDKLKITMDENEKMHKKFQELQKSHDKLQMFLKQHEKLNCLHHENIVQFKLNLRKLKIQRFKYQKLLTIKKKQLSDAVVKNKNLRKTLEKTELSHKECFSIKKSLQSRNDEWETKFEKHLEEDAMERQNSETQKQELINRITEKEKKIVNLEEENKNLKKKFEEWITNEEGKRMELKEIQNDLSKTLNENLKLKEDLTRLSFENEKKEKLISDFEIKANAMNENLNSQIKFYKNESGKLQDNVKKLESQLSYTKDNFAYEKAQKEKLIFELNCKLEENLQISNQKISNLKKLLEDKEENIRKLESENSHKASNNETALNELQKELQLEKLRNNELNKNVENVKESYEDMNEQLKEAKKQISNYKEKFSELNSLNKTLNHNQSEFEKNTANLRMEIEIQKKSFEELAERHRMAEKELKKMNTLVEENASFKSSIVDLKKLLETTEARLEAYKMVVKKLENERAEDKNNHSEEISKLKSEVIRLEETLKKDKYRQETPKNNHKNTPNKKESESSSARAKEKSAECLTAQKLNVKENQLDMGSIEKWHQTTTPPLQSSKKFLSTPRKVLTSTPQPSFRNLTPLQKKRDPYEFDSDSSVERFDQDKVLKVFNRQKKESNKKSKTNK